MFLFHVLHSRKSAGEVTTKILVFLFVLFTSISATGVTTEGAAWQNFVIFSVVSGGPCVVLVGAQELSVVAAVVLAGHWPRRADSPQRPYLVTERVTAGPLPIVAAFVAVVAAAETTHAHVRPH